MIFFGFKEAMVWSQREVVVGKTYQVKYNLKGLSGNPSLEDFYLSTRGHAYQLRAAAPENFQLLEMDAKKIGEIDGFPKNIGFGKLRKMNLKHPCKVAVINLGTTYGDVMHASRAMNFLGAKHPGMEFHVFQIIPDKTKMIYEDSHFVKSVNPLPCSLGDFKKCDYYIDLSGVIGLPGFSVLPLIDFYLGAFSLKQDDVPVQDKRMKLSFPVSRPNVQSNKPLLLFHHTSSADIRSMPKETAIRCIKGLVDEYHVISTVDWEFEYPDYTNLSKETNEFARLSSMVGGVDAVVTVDTCVYHIADAYNVPTVAIFTSVPATLRSKYYPLVRSITLEKHTGRIYGKHMSTNPEDIEYSHGLWDELSVEEIKKLLFSAKQDKHLY